MYATLLQGILSGMAVGSIFALIAIGISMLYRGTGVVNVAHGGMVMIVGLMCATLSLAGVPTYMLPVIGLALGVGVFLVFFVVVLAPLRKLLEGAGLGWVAVTLGVGFVLSGLAAILWGPATRSFSPLWSGRVDVLSGSWTGQKVLAMAVTAFACLALWAILKLTLIGRIVQAAAADTVGAQSVGISITRTQALSVGISGALAGLAAALVVPITGVSPQSGLDLTLIGLSAAILGRIGNIPGALIGGLVLGVVTQVVSGFAPEWYVVAEFSVLLIGVLARPSGLVAHG